MNLFKGILYNIRGLKLGVKTPKLLGLGLLRFVLMAAVTVGCAWLSLAYYQDVLNLIWMRPESAWLVWLWYLLSWIVAGLLLGSSTLLAYVLAQLFFSVVIMDLMARITEKMVSGRTVSPDQASWVQQFGFLIKQEVPRTFLPLLLSLLLMVLGWLTPLAPLITALSSAVAVTFLAWDNTDLIPARRLEPFGQRFRFLRRNLGFHLGFGLPFLIPVANILFLSFAPVGAALYYCEVIEGAASRGSAGE